MASSGLHDGVSRVIKMSKGLSGKASIKGHAPIVRELLRANADIQAARSGGFTPLHMAETREVAKLLLDHGADPTARSTVRPLTS